MAFDKVWVGTANDWNTTTDYSPSGLPTANQTLLMPNGNNNDATGTPAALKAVDLDLWRVDRAFGGQCGSDGAPVELSADVIELYGGQPVYFKDGDGTTDLMKICAESNQSIISLDGSSITKIVADRGNITLKASIGAVTDLHIGNAGSSTDVRMLLAEGGGGVTNVRQGSGFVDSKQAAATLDLSGGTWRQDKATISAAAYVYGGTLDFRFGGTIPLVELWPGGTINAEETSDVKTITTLILHAGADWDYDPSIVSVGTVHRLVA